MYNYRIVIIGGPLSGKSTLAKRISDLTGIKIISNGKLIKDQYKKTNQTMNYFKVGPSLLTIL